MKYIFLILLTMTQFSFAAELKVQELSAKYQSYDGQIIYDCDVKKAHDIAPIYDVYCFDNNDIQKKKFSVVISVSRYTRPRQPANSVELMFRVSDYSQTPAIHSGSTHWVHLKEDSPLHSLSLSQSVENDNAGLYISIKY